VRTQLLRETLAAVRAAGYTPTVEQRRHLHVIWRGADGYLRRVVISRSPSSARAVHENRAVLRRLLTDERA
jgi:hypothetical protein